MRRRRLAIPVLTAAAVLAFAAPAGSHPGHGPPVVEIGTFAFAPASVTVVEGDYVLWDWNGPDLNHSVTADAGQTMSFDSDAGKSPSQVNHPSHDGFSVAFNKAGTYTYHCKVHPGMKGTVKVLPLPDNLKPKPLVKPKLTHVRFTPKPCRHCGGHTRVLVRFRVNEAVSLRATIRRIRGKRPAGHVLKEIDFSGPPGTHTHRLDLGRLRRGTYALRLVAVDSSTGDTTPPAKGKVVVK